MSTLTYSTTLDRLSCGECHIPFAIPSSMRTDRLRDGKTFCCPNGHRVSYHQNENTRLKAELDQAKADARWQAQQKERARADAEHERRRAAAARGQLTKMRNRVARGVCPQGGCKRHFTNLEQHVRTEHPDLLGALEVGA